MINFYDGQITDLLGPNYSADPEVQALSYAIREGTRLLYQYTQLIYIYSNIDALPEKALDLLALELRTQYYDDELPIESKRSLVKGTLIWYTKAGTPEAVEELIAAVFGEGSVKEWFEYGGDPYYFKVITNATMTPDMMDTFSELIRRVKNTRSHIEAIEIHREVDFPQYAGTVPFPIYKPAPIIDGYKVNRSAEQPEYAGTVPFGNDRPPAIIDGYTEHREAAQAGYAGAVQELNYKPAPIIDGYQETGETINQAIAAKAAVMSTYKNIAE